MMNKNSAESEKLKYPIGDFKMAANIQMKDFERAIETIANFPEVLNKDVKDLKSNELNWKYRPGGWRIYEVVHHCSDSHMNAFIRFKKALTEPSPPISGYEEGEWIKLADAQEMPISESIDLLRPLHKKWSYLLSKMSESDFEKGYFHPESQRVVKLSEAVMLYQWHCNHHLAHVQAAKKHKF